MAKGNVESSFECYNADVLLNTKMQTILISGSLFSVLQVFVGFVIANLTDICSQKLGV